MATTAGLTRTGNKHQQVGDGMRRGGGGAFSRRLAVGLAGLILGVCATAACTGSGETETGSPTGSATSSTPSGGSSGTSVAPPLLAPSSTAGPSTPPAASAPPVASTSAAPASPSTHPAALRNMVLTDAVRVQLVHAYVVALHYQPEWITGTRPGSVYYAYDGASNTYLAWTAFESAPGAPEKVLVGMQDGGVMTAFHQRPGAPWETYDICTTPAFLAFVGGELPAGGHC
ncbi:MAG: hypothetical protein ABI890_18705 [Lapillicoccus sp.]